MKNEMSKDEQHGREGQLLERKRKWSSDRDMKTISLFGFVGVATVWETAHPSASLSRCFAAVMKAGKTAAWVR